MERKQVNDQPIIVQMRLIDIIALNDKIREHNDELDTCKERIGNLLDSNRYLSHDNQDLRDSIARLRADNTMLHGRISVLSDRADSLQNELDMASLGIGSGKYGVHLESFGANKINCIKIVRQHLKLGLKACKDLVESAPCKLVANAPEELAIALVTELHDSGYNAYLISPPIE